MKRIKIMGITISTLAPVFVNILGGLFLFISGNRKYINRWFLALFMFDSALLFGGHFLYFHRYVSIYHLYDFVFLFALLSFFSLYFIYVKSVFGIRISLVRNIFHFVPAFVVSAVSLTLSRTAGEDVFREYFFKMADVAGTTMPASSGMFYLYQSARIIHIMQITGYGFYIIYYIVTHMRLLKDCFSNTDSIRPGRFVVINGLFLFFMIVSGYMTTLSGRGFFYSNEYVIYLSGFIFSGMHLMICLYGVRQVPVDMSGDDREHFSGSEDLPVNFGGIGKRLVDYFENERPWLDPDLKIWDVAIRVGTNRTYVSKAINEQLDSNFSDFVNGYRIREAQKIMERDSSFSFSLQAIAEMSGFGSLSSFSRAFRKFEGCTPSEYRTGVCK